MPEPYDPGPGPNTRASSRPAARIGLRSAGSSSRAPTRPTASSSRATTSGKASRKKPGDAHGDVDPGPAQLRDGHDLEALDPAGVLVPDGADAEQGQRLGDVVALGAHVGGAPHDEPDGAGVVAGLGQVALDQPVGQGHADVPRQRRRDGLGVDGVEVAAGGQHVGAAAGGGAAGPGGDVAAGEPGEQVGELVGRAPQGRDQRRRDPRRVGSSAVARSRERCLHPAERFGLDAVDVGGAGVVEVDAELGGDGGPQRRHGALGLAGDGQHRVDQRLAHRRLAEHVEAAADLGVLEGAQVAVDVADHPGEVVGVGHAPRRRGRGPARR